MHYLELGGGEMSLLGLLGALNPDRVDVDLFIYSHQGPLMHFIPEYVNLLPEVASYAVIERPMTEAIKMMQLGVVCGRLRANWKCRRFRNSYPAKGDDIALVQYIGDCVTPWLPKINPNVTYDLCISYMIPHNIGLKKVQARKRLAWIHTDYSTVDIDVNRELPVWGAFDAIASISDDVAREFVRVFPTLKDKIIGIENILSANFIRHRADEFEALQLKKRGLALLSIGRYSYQKNFDNVPDIARRLIDKGVEDLTWYIIGYGGDETLIRQKIAEAGMEEHVIMLGKKDNPYPYIKACDIYVQPSRYEGKSIAVREAQIIGKPVAVTAYPTASSQIKDRIDGVIVPLDNEGCARGLAEFIANKELQSRVVEHLRTHDYANTSEVEKIYDILK